VGLERLLELVREQLQQQYLPHAYLVLVGQAAQEQGLILAEKLRDAKPNLRLVTHCGGGSFKSQFKRADKSGARVALVLGDDEVAQGTVGLKYLREDREQETVPQEALAEHLMGALE